METSQQKNTKRRSLASARRSILSSRIMSKSRAIGRLMVLFLAVVLAFVFGFLVRSNVPLMLSLGVPVEEVVSPTTNSIIASKSISDFDRLSARVSETEGILATYSFDSILLGEATDKVLEGLTESTGDPYAEYFNSERYKVFLMENADKQSSGIGVLFADYNGRAYAMDVLGGSDAEAKGVRQGDFVVAVDGDRSHDWSASEVISILDKREGENVLITWMRPVSVDATQGEEFATALVCGTYNKENVEHHLDDQVGYIRLAQFTANSSKLVGEAIQDLTNQGAKSFVLDITDNPGGYLTQALDIASLFVSSGVLVNIETNDGTTARNASGQTITSAPLVVLINGYTSGVSEVLAAALQDNKRATTVGQTTTGKGSVQVTRELSFGGAIRYTAAYYLTPLGQPINGVGIVPSIETGNQSAESGENQSLNVAMEIARSLINQ